MAPGLEHEISTTVPGSTGNFVLVSIVLAHSVLSPVHLTGKFGVLEYSTDYWKSVSQFTNQLILTMSIANKLGDETFVWF